MNADKKLKSFKAEHEGHEEGTKNTKGKAKADEKP